MPSYVVANHCVNAAITLYFYERALTIGQEIDLIWRRGSRNLFMFALYNGMHVCTIVYLLLEIAPLGSEKSGYIASLAQTAILCALYLIWGAISALRVYAINGRKKWTPLATMAFSLVPIATNVFSLVDATQMNPQYVCCCGQAALSVEAATRVGVMAADSLVLLETWRNTYSLNRLVRGLTTTPSITSLLLRDGTTYFCVLLAVNIIATVLCVKNPVLEMADFCFVFTTILLSRFSLNLREVVYLPELSSTPSTRSGLHFADALRTLGGSLAEHMDYPEDRLDHTGVSVLDIGEEGEYPAEITERPSLSASSLDQQGRADTLQA